MKKALTFMLCLLLLCCTTFLASCDLDDFGDNGSNGGNGDAPHTHAWSEWETITPATCSAVGEEKRTCECGESETRSIGIASDKHTYGTDNTCSGCGSAWKYTEGLKYTAINNEKAYEVSGIGAATDTNIVIPYYYNNKPVTGIGAEAFYDCDSLTSITIPASVTSIGDWAFRECSSLTSITIPEGVTSIGSSAFSICNKLIEVYNLSSLEIIAGSTDNGLVGYYAKNVYTSASTPSKLFTTGDGYIFYDDGTNRYLMGYTGNSAALILPADCNGNNYQIYQYAFYERSSLISITIPEGVTSIGEWAFYDCLSLTSITIPASVTSIGEEAFSFCNKLIEVYNLSSLEIIAGSSDNGYVGRYAKNVYTPTSGKSKLFTTNDGYIFYDDGTNRYLMGYTGNSTALTLPADCNGNNYQIYQYAFDERSSLISITIPEGVTSIGERAFCCCSSLISITIPASVTSIGERAFYSCKSLTSIDIPASVTSIGEDAFEGCSSLTSITIPASVTSIGRNTFCGCSSLTSVTFGENGQLTRIGDEAFSDCTSLTSITIPASVKTIGEYAFDGCSSLTTVTFAEGSQCTSIGWNAFDGCSSLTSITIPEGVTSIGSSAFSYCTSLTSIIIPEGVTSIGNSAFSYCYKLIEVYNLSSLEIIAGSSDNGYVGRYAKNVYTSASTPSKLFTTGDGYIFYDDGINRYLMGYVGSSAALTLPADCNGNNYQIYQYAFYERSSLISITIPASVTSIGNSAFRGCTSLTSINIPASVTSIGDYAFIHCNKLIEVYNLSSLEIIAGSSDNGYVGRYAKNVYTPTSGKSKLFTTNDGYIFYDDGTNRYLMGYTGNSTALTLPADCNGNTYQIYEYAFYECSSLTSITIPASVTSIGECAFYDCSSLTDFTYQGTVDEWQVISKDADWDYGTEAYTITCTDGTISKNGTVTMN